MRITIDIKNNKAGFVMEFLKSLKYVKAHEGKDWAEELDAFQKKFIEQGLLLRKCKFKA